jgi:hypothetical protein
MLEFDFKTFCSKTFLSFDSEFLPIKKKYSRFSVVHPVWVIQGDKVSMCFLFLIFLFNNTFIYTYFLLLLFMHFFNTILQLFLIYYVGVKCKWGGWVAKIIIFRAFSFVVKNLDEK